MEVLNSKSVKNDDRLKAGNNMRLLEVRQASIIKVLKLECEKVKRTSSQKLFSRKQILTNYTIESKVPKSSAEPKNENGWRNKHKRILSLSEQSTELERRRRKEMISLGNSFSISNKASSQTLVANKQLGKNKNIKSMDELRREMLFKGRALGNRYSQTFKRSKNSSTSLITVDELDRYHRLLEVKEKEIEMYNSRKSLKRGDVADKLRREHLKLIDEKTRLEKMFNIKNRRARGEFHKLPIQITLNHCLFKEGKACNVILSQEAKIGQDQNKFNDYKTASNTRTNKLKEETTEIKSLSKEVNANVTKSLVMSCQDYTLNKKFETTGCGINFKNKSCETLCWSLKAGQDVDNAKCDKLLVSQTHGDVVSQKFDDIEGDIVDEGYGYSTLKTTLDRSHVITSTIVPLEVPSERNQSLTSKDNRAHSGGLVEILRKALLGLAASNFIDDLSLSTPKLITSASSSSANRDKAQEIPSNEPWKEDHVMVNAEASLSKRASSKACTQLLHKASTFTSTEEIFRKAMEERRKKCRGDDSDDGENEDESNETSVSESDSNEFVKYVFNFGYE